MFTSRVRRQVNDESENGNLIEVLDLNENGFEPLARKVTDFSLDPNERLEKESREAARLEPKADELGGSTASGIESRGSCNGLIAGK
jgi:hypothetical protein